MLRQLISRLYPLEVEPKSNLDNEMFIAEGDGPTRTVR